MLIHRNIISQIRPDRSSRNSYNQHQSIGSIPTPRPIRRVDKDATEFRQLSIFTASSILDDDLTYYATRGFNLHPEPFRKFVVSDKRLRFN